MISDAKTDPDTNNRMRLSINGFDEGENAPFLDDQNSSLLILDEFVRFDLIRTGMQNLHCKYFSTGYLENKHNFVT